jgi:hypothetical protein
MGDGTNKYYFSTGDPGQEHWVGMIKMIKVYLGGMNTFG